MGAGRWAALVMAGLTACSGSCGRRADADETSGLADRIYVSPAAFDFSENPKLLDRILRSPHGYFRFINTPFSQAACERYASLYAGVPEVNLHGDAHLEQYAVTDLGRGLTDFDDSSKGPAMLDLLRFGASLGLAFPEDEHRNLAIEAFDRFLDGYRAALEDPKHEAPAPDWVHEARQEFRVDREAYFGWVNGIMEPVDPDEQAELAAAMADYVKAMHQNDPELDPRFFDVEAVGRLRMGVGSALDEKYLVRVRGPGPDPLDDVVLEAKEVRSLSGIGCVEGSRFVDPFRILLAQAHLAYEPYAYLGYIDLRGKKFWIHSWVDNYRELKLGDLSDRPALLSQVVYDAGVQLGRGHPKIARGFEVQLRQALLRFLDKNRSALRAAVTELSEATVAAWRRFEAEAQR